MRRFAVISVTAVLMMLASTATAVAQEADADGSEDIVIVEFEAEDVDEAVLDEFYGRLRNTIVDHETFAIGETGEVSIDDLLLMGGCEAPTPECLTQLGDIVQGEHLLFGSIVATDGGLEFSMNLFDFNSQEMTRDIEGEQVTGNQDERLEAIPGVVEYLVYGETAELQVEIAGISEADVLVDGENVGSGTTTVEGLAPGQATVTAVGPDGTEKTRTVVLRHQQPVEVTFEFDPAIAGTQGPSAAPTFIPGLAAGGVGVVGTVVGIIGQVSLSSANSEAEDLLVGEGDERALASADDTQRANELQGEMTTWNTVRWLGFGSGIVGLIGGGALLYHAMFSSGASADGGDVAFGENFDVDFAASSDAVSAGFRIRF